MLKSILHLELISWLDQQRIDTDNISRIRRSCEVPWDSQWNAIVRNETAARELPVSIPLSLSLEGHTTTHHDT